MRRVIWLVLLVAVVWTACGQDESPPVRLDLIPAPDPAAAAAFQALPPSDGFYRYSGLDSMEETILDVDVIARVSLLSKRTDIIQVDDTTWYPVLEFRFRVHEYLKGSGSNEIGGLVWLWLRESTEANARTVAAQMPDAHDSRWDNREAIVFLETERISRGQVLPVGPDQHWFGPIREGGWVYGISVSSPHSKRWLPEVAKSAGARTTAPSEKLFLTDDPLGPETVYGRRVATRNPDSPLPTISLGTLKTRISALEAEANAGGTAEYRVCIEQSYKRLRYKTFKMINGPPGWRRDYTIPSGLPAGTIIDDQEGFGTMDVNAPVVWEFIGLDRELVRTLAVNFRPYPNRPPGYAYTNRQVTTRPLPADTYKYYIHWRSPYCTKDLSSIKKSTVVYLDVTAPDRSVHEAFFDPVAIGEAVGSDDLSPADFSLDGSSTTTITSLKWEDGEVTLALTPTTTLASYKLDFIDVTGTTTLSLTSDNASTTANTWTVPDAPWAAGDLLMLRVSHVPPVSVTLITRENGDLRVEVYWRDPESCGGDYFVGMETFAGRLAHVGGFYGSDATSAIVDTHALASAVPAWYAVVGCDDGGETRREVGRVWLRQP